MSWFSSNSGVSVDQLVKDATDESIPNGEINIVKALELTDLIRSKQAPAKEVMRSLKMRLLSSKNPNLQLSCLELVDFSIKNGGLHFIYEIATREFLDSLNAKILHDDDVDYLVQNKVLKLIQSWAKAFSGSSEFKNFKNLYDNLKKQGFDFPVYEGTENSAMFDSNVPPEWEDSDACMICSHSFSLMNRKHHCRNCGGVYCGEHSSKFLELPDLGITDKVRVCDTCFDEVKAKKKSHKKKKKKDVIKARLNYDSEEDDEDLKRALELSLKESQGSAQIAPIEVAPSETPADQEEDEDLKAAIAASLRDLEVTKAAAETTAPQKTNIYDNLLPQSNYQYQAQEWEPVLPPSVQSYAQQQTYPHQEVPESQPDISSYYHNRLTSQEEHAVRRFTTKAMEAKYNPAEVESLTESYKQAVPLQPKLNNELNDSISKYDQFVDLNYKIDQAMRLYNKILDDRIEREAYAHHPQFIQPQYTSPEPVQPQFTPQYAPQQQQQLPQISQAPQPAQYQSYQPAEVSQQSYPQYVPHSPEQFQASPVLNNQISFAAQYSPQAVSNNDTGNSHEEDPFAQRQLEEEDDVYSAPLGPEVDSSAPPFESQAVAPRPPMAAPVNKITDFNFPNVPANKLNTQQQQNPAVEVAKEELLIEL